LINYEKSLIKSEKDLSAINELTSKLNDAHNSNKKTLLISFLICAILSVFLTIYNDKKLEEINIENIGKITSLINDHESNISDLKEKSKLNLSTIKISHNEEVNREKEHNKIIISTIHERHKNELERILKDKEELELKVEELSKYEVLFSSSNTELKMLKNSGNTKI
jgi:hypothetical protein